jgi:IS5 family transposase
VNDCTQAIELLGQRKAEAVLADKGYDSHAIVEHVEAMGGQSRNPCQTKPQSTTRVRQRSLQTAQPDRTLLQQTQVLPQIRHSI